MFNKIIIGIVITCLLPALTFAHGPARQKVMQEIEINAPLDKVWSIISDFCSIKDWNPQVTGCEITEGNPEEAGAIRVITLENGQKLKEKLIKLVPEQNKIQYMLTEPNIEAFPINTHGSTILLSNEGGKTKVVWKGAFYRSFPGPNPPPELSDEAGQKALTGFYSAGLEKIKTLAE